MRCLKCGSDNREGRKFCTSCGTPLLASCPKCGAPIQAGEKFCGECGTALGDAAPAATAAHTAPPAVSAGGERRHLTVLFCDLVGSTEIAAQLDPEEWREVVAGYHRAAAEAITRFGGHVAKYLGDGVMAYFGWPEAHDNDGERAARAALAILDGISKLNEQPDSLPLKGGGSGWGSRPKLTARVGIDSGAVVVGIGAGSDAEVFGETPNIAARLQATATPGTVLITAATHRLISGLFVVEALGPRALKGIATPLEVFQVIRPTGVRGRLRTARGLTPFVGREEELRLLLSRWERTREGEGQLALIIGEPGIGKSRLVAEFHDRIRDTPHTWMESAGEQFFENTPFHAIIEMLSQWLQLQDATNTEEQCERLERALAAAGLTVTEAAPLIAELLRLPTSERYSALVLTAEQKRRRLLGALGGWVSGAARGQPVVMMVEDLHWLDPSTLELLQLLAEQGATVPLMLLYTARPEFRAPWPMRTHHSQLTLNRLSSRNVREMVVLVAARHALASDSVEAVVERAVGVPLFVEELTRAVLESDNTQTTDREIPATLHDSLMARLDRLGPAKGVIQIGAAIGSEFSYGLLHAVHPIPDEELQGALHSAADAELVYVRGLSPDATYQFKHALIRDAAYEALLRSRRKELHARIAEVLVGQFPDRVTSAPELLAHHYTEAGLIEQAIPYWHQAGQRAIERSANLESINHLKKGLELLKNLPNSPWRAQQELLTLNSLGTPVVASQGYSASEVAQIYNRARELCRELGDSSQLFPTLRGLWAFHLTRAEYQTAYELGIEFLKMARNGGDSGLLVEGDFLVGFTLYFLGEFVSARSYCEDGIAYYNSQFHRSLAFSFGVDPGVNCLSCLPLALWSLGYPDQALRKSHEALTLARELNHPFSMGWALIAATWLRQYRAEEGAVAEHAETAIALAAEQGFPLWSAWARILRAWVLTIRNGDTGAINQIRDGLEIMRHATASELANTHFLALLAEAYAKAHRHEEGLEYIAEALIVADRRAERFYEAELLRLKGELLWMGENPNLEVVENCFDRAIQIARKQTAKSWELRATISLARILRHQGRRDEARSMLADIYGWFTEGFDTTDLKEAKALLEELGGNRP
jgi:class 3 adenylate cyclase/tetratricopeptide (TPR) repeat protein